MSVDVLTTRDEAAWHGHLARLPVKDIAHYPRFCRVYEDKGDGTAECFVYREAGQTVLYPFIRRPLSRAGFPVSVPADISDIITPYCYGGFIHDAAEAETPALLAAFRTAFDDYARSSGIVSEFVRFHPLLGNHRHCDPLFDRLLLHRANIVIDLRQSDDAILQQCRPTVRRYIRRAMDSGLTVTQVPPETACDRFAQLYDMTMRRHGQTGYLNFSRDYFDILFARLAKDLLVFATCKDQAVCAMAIFLKTGDDLDYFLGGSDERYFDAHPNHLLFFRTAAWGGRNGYARLHLGGGRDSLMFFKQGFSKQTLPFYIGHKIHDETTYQQLCRDRAQTEPRLPDRPSLYFPKYREGLE